MLPVSPSALKWRAGWLMAAVKREEFAENSGHLRCIDIVFAAQQLAEGLRLSARPGVVEAAGSGSILSLQDEQSTCPF